MRKNYNVNDRTGQRLVIHTSVKLDHTIQLKTTEGRYSRWVSSRNCHQKEQQWKPNPNSLEGQRFTQRSITVPDHGRLVVEYEAQVLDENFLRAETLTITTRQDEKKIDKREKRNEEEKRDKERMQHTHLNSIGCMKKEKSQCFVQHMNAEEIRVKKGTN